mmetsp:Transcript_22447/g.58601  ORF Transcript_22447/g.58601 Transcript_22447/m.58601 type:complete len:237 (-) Transcript_22447:999-1709(-)
MQTLGGGVPGSHGVGAAVGTGQCCGQCPGHCHPRGNPLTSTSSQLGSGNVLNDATHSCESVTPLHWGDGVGEVVGEYDGEYVGELVVGDAVGDLVGDGVGEVVGEYDGEYVGELVVGDAVGDVVGDWVGASVHIVAKASRTPKPAWVRRPRTRGPDLPGCTWHCEECGIPSSHMRSAASRANSSGNLRTTSSAVKNCLNPTTTRVPGCSSSSKSLKAGFGSRSSSRLARRFSTLKT